MHYQQQGSRRLHFTPFPADPICSERVTMHCQWGRKHPKLPPSPWDFVIPPEEDPATAICNMHKKW